MFKPSSDQSCWVHDGFSNSYGDVLSDNVEISKQPRRPRPGDNR